MGRTLSASSNFSNSLSKSGKKAVGKRIFVEQTIKALKVDLAMERIPSFATSCLNSLSAYIFDMRVVL